FPSARAGLRLPPRDDAVGREGASMASDSSCPHLIAAAKRAPARPNAEGCSECLASGGEWVHLRLCLTCGHVGCCDNSPGRHATKHARAKKHPVIRSYEPDE